MYYGGKETHQKLQLRNLIYSSQKPTDQEDKNEQIDLNNRIDNLELRYNKEFYTQDMSVCYFLAHIEHSKKYTMGLPWWRSG